MGIIEYIKRSFFVKKSQGDRVTVDELISRSCKWNSLYGAVIGDICGSIYEFSNWRTDNPAEINLINDSCYFTDDTVLTAALADAIENKVHHFRRRFHGHDYGAKDAQLVYSNSLRQWAHVFDEPYRGYGSGFMSWLYDPSGRPRQSCGNGAAMRISPIAWYFCKEMYPCQLAGLLEEAKLATMTTHGHPEGIKGAQAVCAAMCYAWHDFSKEEIRQKMAEYYPEGQYSYHLNHTLADIRPTYDFSESCMDTVPVAIIAFLESHDFVSAIQNAISVGGDSDTLAAITGSIAEAYYREIPEDLKAFARSKLPFDIQKVLGMTR